MCLSPIYKENPSYRKDCDNSKLSFADLVLGRTADSPVIRFPCGHCGECIAVKQSSFNQRVTEESRFSHLFFATLTYDNKHLPVLTLQLPAKIDAKPSAERSFRKPAFLGNPIGSQSTVLFALSSGELETLSYARGKSPKGKPIAYRNSPVLDTIHASKFDVIDAESEPLSDEFVDIPYADIHDLQLMFKRMRDNNTIGRDFRYIAVSERGKTGGRPHFHILFLIRKQPGDNLAICESINVKLKHMLLAYWSRNVGTRKNPVYERNFTYRQKWIGGRLFKNFDCHYVNPVLTKDGVSNVSYYVTKYLFKESKHDNELYHYLRANFGDSYSTIWDVIKSRFVCSKGLGLDAECYTIPSSKIVGCRPGMEDFLCVYLHHEGINVMTRLEFEAWAKKHKCQFKIYQEYLNYNLNFLKTSLRYTTDFDHFLTVPCKRRVLVPNFDLMQQLKSNALRVKASGLPVYVTYNGKMVSLATYYKKRVLDLKDLTDLYYSWDPALYPDSFEHRDYTEEELRKRYNDYARRRKQMDSRDAEDVINEVTNSGQDIDPYSPYVSSHKLVLCNSQRISL